MAARRRKTRKPARRAKPKPRRSARARARPRAKPRPKAKPKRKAPQPARKSRPQPRPAPAERAPATQRVVTGAPIEVGVVLHYFPRAEAAVVALSRPIHRGDTIHVRGQTTDFVQPV